MIVFIWSLYMRVLTRCGGALLLSSLLLTAQTAPAPIPAASERKLLDQYCVTCHNQLLKTAGLTLDKLDPANVAAQPESWEKVVRKLRAGMMPPSGLPRPAAADYAALTISLENDLDRVAAAKP